MLKTEVQVMLQHLRRLDPNAPHMYGHFTSQLSQGGPPSASNGTQGHVLPPMSAQPAAAMQGVEYGGYGSR